MALVLVSILLLVFAVSLLFAGFSDDDELFLTVGGCLLFLVILAAVHLFAPPSITPETYQLISTAVQADGSPQYVTIYQAGTGVMFQYANDDGSTVTVRTPSSRTTIIYGPGKPYVTRQVVSRCAQALHDLRSTTTSIHVPKSGVVLAGTFMGDE